MSAPKKVVLAYSGGLDTSIILKWLQTEYGCEVVTFTADLGQGEELEPARAKAEMLGVKEIFIEDVREEFVRDFVFPMFRANAVYEGLYLLGTSIARPLISKRLVEIAAETGADAVAHGATGKGNDQVRFELACYALNPEIKVIAPWREWNLNSRTSLLDFAEKNQIPIAKDKRGEAPFSVDANLLHTSSEGRVLEDPAVEAPEYVYQRTDDPVLSAPNEPQYVEITFEKGDAVAIDGEAMSPATILTKLNELGKKHGIGRLDFVENRFVGMKSRGIYETPGGEILLEAHRGIEQITLDSGAGHLKDLDHAALRGTDLQRLLVQPRTRDAAGADRQVPGVCHRHREADALQGFGPHRSPLVRLLALFGGPCDLRGRCGRLRSEGRSRVHPAERPAAEAAGGAQQAREVTSSAGSADLSDTSWKRRLRAPFCVCARRRPRADVTFTSRRATSPLAAPDPALNCRRPEGGTVMTMEEIAAKIARGLEKRPVEDSFKFDCGEDGAITIRDGGVVLADEPADCTIHISRANLVKLMAGDLNPMTAFAFGKIKVSGDMGLAMKLGKVLG